MFGFAASAITSPYSFLQFFSTAMFSLSSPVVDSPTVTEEPLTATVVRSLILQEVTAALWEALPMPASVTPPVPTSEAPGPSGHGEAWLVGLACMQGVYR